MSVSSFTNPAPDEVLTFLKGVQRIAVVGLSPQQHRPSHQIARVLQRHGFQIVPVRPGVAEILGEQAYSALDQVPGKIDLVDVFRAAEHVPAIVDQALALGIPGIWLQDGVIAPAAAQRAASGGMFVVMDDCLGRFLRRHGRPGPA
ncbi:MAG TPA: CoA-binding protein [Gammaproteobacteria bacterium]|nr:CoA-binding protein [Gammaproteobacteria bacterium]